MKFIPTPPFWSCKNQSRNDREMARSEQLWSVIAYFSTSGLHFYKVIIRKKKKTTQKKPKRIWGNWLKACIPKYISSSFEGAKLAL